MALKSARCPALALFLIVAGCADIPRFEPDTCGNLVVEAGEDCDTFADPDRGEALSCGPADGSPSACRYLCGGDARCPEGWVCSADLTCRHPDGRFVLADDPALILRADQLELADLTGDGVQEVVRRVGGALEALSLAGEPRVVAQAAFEALRGPLHAAPLDPELGPGGLFLPAAAAAATDDAPLELHVLWGGSGHLGTALAPRRSVAAPGPVLAAVPAPVLDGEVLVYLSAVGGGVALAAPDPACPSAVSAPMAGDAAAALRPSIARTQDGLRVVVAFEGAATAWWVSAALGADGCMSFSPPVQVDLPGAVTGLALADLEPDGWPELLAYLSDETVAVAPGDAAGFGPAAVSTRFQGLDQRPEGQPVACNGERLVLATGDLDADGRPDLVTEDGVFLLGADAVSRVFARIEGDAWAEAVLADVNRDGLMDVVATPRAKSAGCDPVGLTALLQVRPGAFSPRAVADVAKAQSLRVGDFDGDGVTDVAAVTEGAAGQEGVTVFFGDPRAPLEDRTFAAGPEEIAGLEAVLSLPRGPNPDPAHDVVLFPADDRMQSILLLGAPTRGLLGPAPLGDPVAGTPGLAVVAGPLLGETPDLPDSLVLGPDAAWLLPGDEAAAGGAPHPVSVEPQGAFHGACALYAGPTDSDTPVIFAVDGARPVGLADSVDPGCGGAPFIAALNVAMNGVEVATRAAPPGVGVPTHLVRADLDDEGHEDLVVVFAPASPGGRGTAWLYLNPEVAGATLVGPEPQPLLPGRDVWGAAALNVDDDPTPELALFTDGGLFIARDEGEGLMVEASPVAPVPDRDPHQGPVVLRAGALDADGIPDLVLLFGEGLFPLRGRAHR